MGLGMALHPGFVFDPTTYTAPIRREVLSGTGITFPPLTIELRAVVVEPTPHRDPADRDYSGGMPSDQQVRITTVVPDRDTGVPTTVVFIQQIPRGLMRDPHDLLRYVRSCIVKALEHEVDEQLLVNGERVFNPHAEDHR